MIVVVDRDLRIVRASRAFAQLAGTTPASLQGAPLDPFLRGGLSSIRRAIEAGAELTTTLPIQEPRGVTSPRELTVTPLPDRAGAILQIGAPVGLQWRLEEILDHVSDGFAVWDRDWRYLHVNRAAETFYGRPREELIGRRLWELYPLAIGTDLERQMRRAAVERTPLELELVSPQFGRWIHYRFFPYERGLAMFFRDVDEEHRLREALRESEERHRSMFQHSLIGWMLTAPDGRILSANPAACRMLRRTEEEIVEVGREGVVDRTDPRVTAALTERGRTGSMLAEVHLKRGDGTRFPALVSSAIFRNAAGEERTSLSFYDLTERRRAEDALVSLAEAGAVLTRSLDVEATLQALVGFIVPRLADGAAIELADDDGPRCAIAKHRDPTRDLGDLCAEPWPVAVGEVLRTGQASLVERVDEAWLAWATAGEPDTLARARASEATSLVIAPLMARDRTLGALIMMYVDDARRFDRESLWLVRSLAERAALAVDNARQHLDALEAKRLRDEVLGFVAHDLRSPLQSIAVSAELLAGETGDRSVEVIQRSVARANRLIDDLLTAVMLEGGTLPLQRREEPIEPIIEEVIELHRPLASSRSIALDAHVPEHTGAASVDRHRLVQLLSNLVSNALKFTPDGGRVDVEVEPSAKTIELRVRDTGCGIAPEELPHVFDRFWQSQHQRRGGAGLGLAICRGIADAHGGQLDVKSELGKGTTFRLVLPRGGGSAPKGS